MIEHPKVFISYSHDSEEHKEWVLELATNLRKHGIDVILDQWELTVGKDLRFFMEQGLGESRFIICVCSSEYVKKANSGSGGVGYESTIISSDILTNSNIDNILPIIKNNPDFQKTPIFLSNKYYADFDNGNYYEEYRLLIEKIYGESEKKKPALGNSPFALNSKASLEIKIKNDLEKNRYLSFEKTGVIKFDYNKNNGIFTIGVGNMQFDTSWSACGSNCIYAISDMVKLIGYKDGNYDYPKNTEDLKKFDYTSRCVRVYENEIVIFMNEFGNFVAIKVLVVNSKPHGHRSNLLEFEYKILDFNSD